MKLNLVPLKHLVLLSTSMILQIRPIFDFDLWWHMAVGRYIYTNLEIPTKDIFTYSAPEFPYVYHSWLSEVLLYSAYKYFHLWGVTIFYTFVGSLGVLFLVKTIQIYNKYQKLNLSLIIYAGIFSSILVTSTNLRIQIISFLMLSIQYYLLESNYYHKSNTILWLPLIYLIWANLHGGFILGLQFFILYLIFYLVSNYKIKHTIYQNYQSNKLIINSLALSLISPLINPYFYRIYYQAIIMGTNKIAFMYNNDWFPLYQETAAVWRLFTFILVISSLIYIKFSKKTNNINKMLLVIFLLLSIFYSKRYITVIVMILMPGIYLLIQTHITQILLTIKNFPIIKNIVILICLLFISSQPLYWIPGTIYAYQSPEKYAKYINENSKKISYPYHALNYLAQNQLPNNILNDFNWGGYLSWNYPDKKIFIDGRMDNFISKVNGEPLIYITYIDFIQGKSNWQQIVDKHKINTILIMKQHKIVEILNKSIIWKLEFQDNYSVIFTRKELLST